MKYDVCIVGAGLSGLAALNSLQKESLSIALVDDRSRIGGNFLKRRWLMDESTDYTDLLDQPIGEKVDVFLNHEAIGVYEDLSLSITDRRKITRIKANTILQCTGSRELPYLFEGWQLPGVITLDAYLQLRYLEQVDFPKRIGLVGTNPNLTKVDQQLRDEGHEVVLASPAQSVKATGENQVNNLIIEGESHKVDVVITSKRYIPVNELAHLYKNPKEYTTGSRDRTVEVADHFYRAGQSTGIKSAEESIQSGVDAATDMIQFLKKVGV